jgi:hypothetical protein
MITKEMNQGLDTLVTVSISEHITENFKQLKVPFYKVVDLVKSKFNYSAGSFKDGYRKKENYVNYSDLIILDVDNGLTLKEAHQKFLPYNHIIATTKSHQKEKNGLVCDRFRVILPTETPITLDSKECDILMRGVMREYNFVDQSCKDSSRFYYPAKDSIVVHKYGFVNFVWQDIYNKEKQLIKKEKEESDRLRNFNQSFNQRKPAYTFEGTKEDYLRSILFTEKLLKLLKFNEKFGAGGRNTYLYAAGCYLKDNKMTDGEIKDSILWLNAQGDGIPEHEINSTIFKSLRLA